MARGYQVLPLIYDRWQRSYGKDYTSLILPRLLSCLKLHDLSSENMVDIACGTGTLARHMTRRGWRVWGVDASPLMIEQAMRKNSRRSARFLRQDMRDLRLPEPVHLATCLFDSINHLKNARELAGTFRRVADALVPGGLFVFDVNNERCYKTLWTRTEAIHHHDFTLIMQNAYSAQKQSGYAMVTIFLRRRADFSRFSELIQERYFPPAVIARLLVKSGFRVLEREDFNFTSIREIGDVKTWWVARKIGT
jgi:SAM-dependent methyltransferase